MIDRLTAEQAARLLGISTRTLADIRRTGEIEHYRPSPRKIFYTEQQIADYLARKVVSVRSLGHTGNHTNEGESLCTVTKLPGIGTYRLPDQAADELDRRLARPTRSSRAR
jgi:hypothetical protein